MNSIFFLEMINNEDKNFLEASVTTAGVGVCKNNSVLVYATETYQINQITKVFLYLLGW